MVVRKKSKTKRRTRYNTRRRMVRQTKRVKKHHSNHVKKRRRKTNKMNRNKYKKTIRRQRLIQEGGMFSCCARNQTHPEFKPYAVQKGAEKLTMYGTPEWVKVQQAEYQRQQSELRDSKESRIRHRLDPTPEQAKQAEEARVAAEEAERAAESAAQRVAERAAAQLEQKRLADAELERSWVEHQQREKNLIVAQMLEIARDGDLGVVNIDGVVEAIFNENEEYFRRIKGLRAELDDYGRRQPLELESKNHLKFKNFFEAKLVEAIKRGEEEEKRERDAQQREQDEEIKEIMIEVASTTGIERDQAVKFVEEIFNRNVEYWRWSKDVQNRTEFDAIVARQLRIEKIQNQMPSQTPSHPTPHS